MQQAMHDELGDLGSMLVWSGENMLDYDVTSTLVC